MSRRYQISCYANPDMEFAANSYDVNSLDEVLVVIRNALLSAETGISKVKIQITDNVVQIRSLLDK